MGAVVLDGFIGWLGDPRRPTPTGSRRGPAAARAGGDRRAALPLARAGAAGQPGGGHGPGAHRSPAPPLPARRHQRQPDPRRHGQPRGHDGQRRPAQGPLTHAPLANVVPGRGAGLQLQHHRLPRDQRGPGGRPGDEAPRILAELERPGWKAVRVVHTHAHFDHVMGTADVSRATGAETALHKGDRWLYDHVPDQLRLFRHARARGHDPAAHPRAGRRRGA